MPETSRGIIERIRREFDPAAWSFDATRQDGGRRVRRAMKAGAFRLGLGPQLRRVRASLEPQSAKRERREDANLRLLMAFSLERDSNCIDVGASVGGMLEDIVHFAPEGRHIAYEPLPAMREALVERFPGVEVRSAALSNETGETSFVYVKSRAAYSGLKERDYPGKQESELITVHVERLDDALPDGYVPALIKIDVEGAELQVLEGARRTLAAHRPIVVFEHTKGAAEHYGTTPAAVHDLFSEVGLRVFDLHGEGPYSREEFDAAFERAEHFNFVAKP